MKISRFLPEGKEFHTLEEVVEDWTYRFGKKGELSSKRDMVVEYCHEAPTPIDAIRRACASRDANGKMHNHQTRVREKARQELAHRLMHSKKGPQFLIAREGDFDAIYEWVLREARWGIGPVTVYDVATRLAAYAGVEPQTLYLHAGVREGWERLIGQRERRHTIPREDLPKPFLALPTDEVEDLLCTYRDILSPSLLVSQ